MAKKRSSNDSVALENTMTRTPEGFQLLYNLENVDGVLERRPAIIAIEHGFSNVDVKRTTGTGAKYTQQSYPGGDDTYTLDDTAPFEKAQHLGLWTVQGFQRGNVSGDHASQETDTYVYEGIDVQISANGRLVCLWLGGTSVYNSGAARWSLNVSAHSGYDPKIGRLVMEHSGVSHAEFDSFTNNAGDTEYIPDMQGSVGASWQNKRIHVQPHGFMVVGRGLRAGDGIFGSSGGFNLTHVEKLVSSGAAANEGRTDQMIEVDPNTGAQTTVTDDTGIIFVADSGIQMFGVSSHQSTFFRGEMFADMFSKKRPRNAFAHTDRLGQTIFYGFTRSEKFELMEDIPANNILNHISQENVGTNYFLAQEYTAWFSETVNPLSLPAFSFVNAVNHTRNAQVVGMEEYQSGTAVFTRDSIAYLTGVGAGGDQEQKNIKQGIGADARMSIKRVGDKIAFLNKRGLYVLGPDAETGQMNAVIKISAFDELFSKEGIQVSRGPYDDLHGSLGSESNHEYMDDTEKYDHQPWGLLKVDMNRIEKAVGCVWGDLYLCAVSAEGHKPGDDNRMVLVLNYKTGASTVWMMPRNMGIRGFAYDGRFSVPYIMTRYGLARFGNRKEQDHVWTMYSTGALVGAGTSLDGSTITKIGQAYPMVDKDGGYPCVLARSHFLPGTGDSVCLSSVIIDHDMNMSGLVFQQSSSDYVIDSDMNMRIQMWSHVNEVAQGRDPGTLDTGSINNTDVGILDNLYANKDFNGTGANRSLKDFIAFRAMHLDQADDSIGYHVKKDAYSAGDAAANPSSRRMGRDINRVSVAKSGWNAVRHKFQFHTLNPVKIRSVQVTLEPVAPKGYRG